MASAASGRFFAIWVYRFLAREYPMEYSLAQSDKLIKNDAAVRPLPFEKMRPSLPNKKGCFAAFLIWREPRAQPQPPRGKGPFGKPNGQRQKDKRQASRLQRKYKNRHGHGSRFLSFMPPGMCLQSFAERTANEVCISAPWRSLYFAVELAQQPFPLGGCGRRGVPVKSRASLLAIWLERGRRKKRNYESDWIGLNGKILPSFFASVLALIPFPKPPEKQKLGFTM